MGGGARIRNIWSRYYAECHAILFVVDAADSPKLNQARDALFESLTHSALRGKPLLIVANKQDVPGAMSPSDLETFFSIPSFLKQHPPTSSTPSPPLLESTPPDHQPPPRALSSTLDPFTEVKVVGTVARGVSEEDPSVSHGGEEVPGAVAVEVTEGLRWLVTAVDAEPGLYARVQREAEAQRAEEERLRTVRRTQRERERALENQPVEAPPMDGADDEEEVTPVRSRTRPEGTRDETAAESPWSVAPEVTPERSTLPDLVHAADGEDLSVLMLSPEGQGETY